MAKLPPVVRTGLIRIGQIAVTFVLFALFNALAVHFEVENGVSILFPATAVSIVACMYFGVWAAIGIMLATFATPWSPNADFEGLFLSGLVSSCEGMIPWLVFRVRRDLHTDLRDMRSFLVFLLFGTLINTTFSAIAGNLLVVAHATAGIVWREVFVWWIADFTAALLLATPFLAFGGNLFAKLRSDRKETELRTIVNALQILTVIILLGWGASFAIRLYLLDRLEEDRLVQQHTWSEAAAVANRMHSNFLRAAFIDRDDPHALAALETARATNAGHIATLQSLLRNVAPELQRALPPIATATTNWFATQHEVLAGKRDGIGEQEGAHLTGRSILALRSMMERGDQKAWANFSIKRRRIMFVTTLVDVFVLVILLLASATLLLNISRPFAQIRSAIAAMREGATFESRRIDSRYLEFRSLAETIEETATELRRREEELRLQTERAIAASKHKSDFLAKMSHELRTPLNSIIGFSDLLIEQDETITPQKRIAFLTNVSSSATHLLGLINDLLDIAKVEAGKMPMNFGQIDLRHAIANTVSSTAPLFGRKSQEIELDLAQEPMFVRGDQSRVEQVLLNLLSNANKFSPAGGKITIRTRSADDRWQIEIADRGIGISAADQERIFRDFEQVYHGGLHPGGTGLGLALAKRFIEAHGGAIDVESAVGEGSLFRVTLPRWRPEAT
jgi:signal transduction histidine kinase/integral membrane sensor domain MASE1